jgi:hypothetical protein
LIVNNIQFTSLALKSTKAAAAASSTTTTTTTTNMQLY